MLNRFLLAVTLACVCGMVGSVFVGPEGNAARVEAATNAACSFTTAGFTPPQVGSEPFDIFDISAFGTNDVWVAGRAGIEYHTGHRFLLHWDGAEWEDRTDSILGRWSYDALLGGSGGSDVWHVIGPGAIHWDGEKWGDLYSLPDDFYSAIYARTPDDVWMAGLAIPASNTSFFAHWDGSNWKRVEGPTYDKPVRLNALVAVSPNSAWAVGARVKDDQASGVLLHWDGDAWQKVKTPKRRGTEWLALAAVNQDDVWAVGKRIRRGITSAITMHWNGVEWKLKNIPVPEDATGGTALSSVAALASDNVWAVGATNDGSLIVRWDGTRWHRQSKPNIIGRTEKIVAEGSDRLWIMNGGGIIRGDGATWSYGNLPWFGYYTGGLRRVEALSKDDVWALGSAVVHWDGKAWNVAFPASDAVPNANFVDIAVRPPDELWMLGYYGTGVRRDSVVVYWDGSVWTRMPDPPVGTRNIYMGSIAVLAGDDVWIAGYEAHDAGKQRLAMHWDGQMWSETVMPNGADDGFAVISRIYARAGDDVWALGSEILHWNGTEWSVSYPARATALTALAADDVWATMFFGDFLHFDGTQWQVVPKAEPDYVTYYAGLIPIALDDIYAVGSSARPWGEYSWEIQLWDGNEWQIADFEYLGFGVSDVAVVSPDEYWTVGTEKPFYGLPYAVIHRFTRTCE